MPELALAHGEAMQIPSSETSPESDREMLKHLVKEISELRESHEKILALVSEIKEQVEPTINALKDSSILKMMGVV
jgi:hypothetical protein